MNKYVKTGNRQKPTRFSRTLSQILTNPISIALAFSPWIVLAYVLLRTYFVSLEPNDTMMIMNFIEWFGIPYGLLSILVLMKVWNNFEALEREFDREVSTMARLVDAVALMSKRAPTPLKSKAKIAIADSITAYVNHILRSYDRESRDDALREEGDYLLSRLFMDVNSMILKPRNGSSFSTIDSLVNQLFDARRERLMLSRQRLPTGIWFLLIISSILWLLPFLALAIYNPIVNLLVIGSVSFVIVLLVLIIEDLNKPFSGNWSISLNQLITVQELAIDLGIRIKKDQSQIKQVVPS